MKSYIAPRKNSQIFIVHIQIMSRIFILTTELPLYTQYRFVLQKSQLVGLYYLLLLQLLLLVKEDKMECTFIFSLIKTFSCNFQLHPLYSILFLCSLCLGAWKYCDKSKILMQMKSL